MRLPGGYLLVLISATVAAGCVTIEQKPEYEEAEIKDRIEGADETPEWATGQRVMWEEDGEVVFVSIMSMKGNARPEACLKVAGLSAKAEMLRHVKEQISTSGQLVEEGAENDPAFESMTAFLSQGTVSGARIAEQHYDKREESAETGERVLRLRCAVKVAVKKAELARQLAEATKVDRGNPEIREKLLQAQKSFFEGLVHENALAH